MSKLSELDRLLEIECAHKVRQYDSFIEINSLLRRDASGEMVRALEGKLGELRGWVWAGVIHELALRYFETGDLADVRRLFAIDHADAKAAVLGAMWQQPPARHPELGSAAVEMALEGARHPAAEVRASACDTIMNQAAWSVDVSATTKPLLALLADASREVRYRAACAVGKLAERRKHDLAAHVKPLTRNLRRPEWADRNWSAAALRSLARFGRDIGAAVPDLMRVLASRHTDDDDPRQNASAALLHHARKSWENLEQVRRSANAADLDGSLRVVTQFRDRLREARSAILESAGAASDRAAN